MDKNLYQKIILFLTKHIKDIDSIYIFGSYASKDNTDASDIDIAFLNKIDLTPVEMWDISSTLSNLLMIDVDLIDLKNTNTVFRFEIIHKGIKIYEADKKTVEEFEDLTYSFYLELNEIRTLIIQDMQKDGISRDYDK